MGMTYRMLMTTYGLFLEIHVDGYDAYYGYYVFWVAYHDFKCRPNIISLRDGDIDGSVDNVW